MLFLGAAMIQDGPPPVPREFRAAWIATVDNIDWPSRRDLTPAAQRQEMVTILDRLAKLNMNAVVFQIRPTADALYESKIEPWSEYLTGKQGMPPNPPYDPLAFTVSEARKRGIEVHVWFNPYRARHPSAKGDLASNHVAKTHPLAVLKYGTFLWMDPGDPFTKKRTLQVIGDVVKRYDIDGVHIDDYFYPYPIAGQVFPDNRTYQAFRKRGGKLSKEDWRRKNVDDFVHDFYREVKRLKPWVKVGISPFGIYRPGVPTGIRAGVDQYADLYADALKWFRRGWCDYYAPQLYWPIAQTPQAFPTLLNWWDEQNVMDRHLWVGQFTSRTNPSDGNWPATEVTNQIGLTREKVGGTIHFSVKAIMRNWNGIGDALEKTYAQPATIPASPWLPGRVPGEPKLRAIGPEDGATVELQWDSVPDAHWYGVALRQGGAWRWTRFQSGTSISLPRPEAVAVVGIGRTGRAGPITRLDLP